MGEVGEPARAEYANHLLLVAATRQVSHAHCRLPEFNHQGGKVPVGSRATLALWHPEYID
jgi:hypothetical protein